MNRRWLLRGILVLIVLIFVVPFIIPLPTVGVDAQTFSEADGRFIQVNGLETYVREAGDPDGMPVLLLHGWGGSTFSWRDTLPFLAEQGYRTIAFDRPPYGLSAKTGEAIPYSQREQADFTLALMDALAIDRAVLIGHSMGGGVITYFADAYPERLIGLVFVDGALPILGDPVESDNQRMPGFVSGLLGFQPVRWWARLGIRGFVRPDSFADMQRTAYYDPVDVSPEVTAGYAEQLQVTGWDEALIEILRGWSFSDTPLSAEQVSAIIAPTLIVWGENDTWVDISRGERLRELLPNDQWITYPETGHLPMEEQPEAFNRDLGIFLASLTLPSR